MSLNLLFSDAPERCQRVSLLGGKCEAEAIRQAALWLLGRQWKPSEGSVRYMHVIAGKLTPRARRQRSLLDVTETNQAAPEKLTAVADVLKGVNEKVGRFAIRSGSTLPLTDVHADPANDYDICDIYGKSCF